MALFMQVEGIKGSATEDKHKEWISIGSMQWGVGRGISSPTGATADREASVPSLSEIVVTKESDASSSDFFKWSLGLSDAKKVVIEQIVTGRDEPVFRFTMFEVMISGFSQSSGGDALSESLSLNFTKIEMRTMSIATDATPAAPVTVTWDIATATGG